MLFMSTESKSSLATRPSLLARLKDWGQQTAWREFDHKYSPLIRNVARKAGLTAVEGDEVAQETLIAVAKNVGKFQHAGNRGSFRAWLYQQARWRVADQFRKRQARPASTLENVGATPEDNQTVTCHMVEQPAAAGSEFEKIWDEEWRVWVRQLAIAEVKRQVSARQFQLFDLHALQGLSVREAATTGGSTMAAVYMAKSRVGRLFRRELKLAAGEGS
jgi:RNA polymerase sigma factor (sigma-70 family)